MAKKSSRKGAEKRGWPRKVALGRVSVTIYQRFTPGGIPCYRVANYASGKRRLDSYPTEAEAMEAAKRLSRQLSERQVVAASLTNEQAADYAAAVQVLAPFKLPLATAASTLAECLKLVGGDLPGLHGAAKFYAVRHRQASRKPVGEAVAELIALKEGRKASARYLKDLRARLDRFADAFRKDCGDVTTAQVQGWLDGLKLSRQSYKNYRTVAHTRGNPLDARSA